MPILYAPPRYRYCRRRRRRRHCIRHKSYNILYYTLLLLYTRTLYNNIIYKRRARTRANYLPRPIYRRDERDLIFGQEIFFHHSPYVHNIYIYILYATCKYNREICVRAKRGRGDCPAGRRRISRAGTRFIFLFFRPSGVIYHAAPTTTRIVN